MGDLRHVVGTGLEVVMVDSFEQAVGSTMAHLYGQPPALIALPSNNNRVYRAIFPGAMPDRVVKVAGASAKACENILREQAVLPRLQLAGLEVPTIQFTQRDASALGVPFFTMPLQPGCTLAQACKEGQASWAETACHRLGGFVRQIAAADSADLPLRAHGEQLTFLSQVRDGFLAEQMLRPPFAAIIDHAERLLHGPGLVPIHGDFSWSQVITDGDSFVVIDWESACLGHPLSMLGRAIAMMREYGGRPEHIRWATAGFAAGGTLSASDVRDLHLWEMWHHVGCMGWKFVCGPDHRAHAFAMAKRVEKWAEV
jgi:aminoglycoside phosphotransferase (APT) family kinase protein